MSGRDIVFFSGIDWFGNNTMPCHHVVRRLARRHRILYIDNFGAARDLDRYDLRRALTKGRTALFQRWCAGRSEGGADPSGENNAIIVRQPCIVPTPRGGWMRKINSVLLSKQIQRWMRQHKLNRPIIWTRVPTEPVWRCVASLERSLLLYQSIDKFPEHPRIAPAVQALHRPWEERFNREADLVFCSGRRLWEEKRRLNPSAHFFPNGAAEIFRQAGEPTPLDGRRPVVGFAGAIGASLNIPWVAKVAAQRPEMDFVLVGKIDQSVDLEPLKRQENIRLVGLVPHEKLPDVFGSFDAAIMAYAPIRFQQYTFPSKMAEYLLAGLPVVSNRIPEIEPYAHVVTQVDSPAEMASALQTAVQERFDSAKTKARRAVGESLSWDAIVARMEEVIEERLKDLDNR